MHATDAVQRQPHDALRHPTGWRGPTSCSTCSTSRRLPSRGPPLERSLRRHRAGGGPGLAGRHSHLRHCRRPAGRAVRPGLLRAGHDQEHLRHRQLRAHERGPDLPAAGRRPADQRGLDPRATPATTAYALEGAIFVTGAAIQWLRDGLGIIAAAAEIGPLAASVADTEGVFLVPAFAGLGSPWWDPYARGTIVGLTRGIGRAQLARAVVEAMAYQTRDVVDAMSAASGHPDRRVCGSTAAHRSWTCCCSSKPTSSECRWPGPGSPRPPPWAPPTWPAWPRGSGRSLDEVGRPLGVLDAEATPQPAGPTTSTKRGCRAVERSRRWEPEEDPPPAG